MSAGRRPVRLPEHLHRYFWDHDVNRLTLDEGRHTIIQRLLEAGGWDAVQWLLANLDDDELRDFIARRQGRGLSPKRLRFWGLILDNPRPQVDQWIAAQRENPWHRRTG
jgi:hypothetical protein